MSQTVPDFSTAIITILFLLVLGVIAFVVKKKSGPLKRIIKNQNNLEVINQLPLRDGYLAYILRVGNENFFFVGHKSGRCSLTQVNSINEVEPQFKKNKIEKLDINKISTPENKIIGKIEEKKPLQHVNISDLLTAHKKGSSNA
jgi:flagellar biogenesis protein FliO